LIGYNCGKDVTTGGNNTFLGAFGGQGTTSGANNIMLGDLTDNTLNRSRSIALGGGATIEQNRELVVGGTDAGLNSINVWRPGHATGASLGTTSHPFRDITLRDISVIKHDIASTNGGAGRLPLQYELVYMTSSGEVTPYTTSEDIYSVPVYGQSDDNTQNPTTVNVWGRLTVNSVGAISAGDLVRPSSSVIGAIEKNTEVAGSCGVAVADSTVSDLTDIWKFDAPMGMPPSRPFAHIRAVAVQSVTNASEWGVEYDSNVKLVDITHPISPAPDNQRITVTKSGHYQINYEIWWVSVAASDIRDSYIGVNGATTSSDFLYARVRDHNISGNEKGIVGSAIVPLSANDYIELFVQQNSGGNLDLGQAQNSRRCEITVCWVAPL
jgi:hypothetical protein